MVIGAFALVIVVIGVDHRSCDVATFTLRSNPSFPAERATLMPPASVTIAGVAA